LGRAGAHPGAALGHLKAMDVSTLRNWLTLMAGAVHEQRDALTALDAAIGDADYGANLDRGFSAVTAKLPEWDGQDAAALLAGAAKTLISTIGGSSGVFYGTALLRMSAALAGKTIFDDGDLLAALDAAAAGIAARGRSTVGEKTMLDAWVPAVEALRLALAGGEDIAEAMAAAALAAEQGADSTIAMLATKGRAANLGPRGIGHKDPGAAGVALLFRTLAEAVSGVLLQVRIPLNG
jgi:phosphoenolpyruvate---glycerone phosphotransferase subunit DhaL